MFKTFGFWISVVGFACVWLFARELYLSDYLGVMAGCIIINNAYAIGRLLGD